MSARARRATSLLASLVISVPGTTVLATAAPAATEVSAPGLYLVTLADPPRPDRADRQRAAQDALLQRAGDPEVVYRFGAALNGFAAQLTREQVKQLRADPAVTLVERSTTQRTDSVDSPGFIGADEAWDAVGGQERAGRGTVVGVIDSGIWPENPTFAALPDASTGALAGFEGDCQVGEEWDEADCNSKIVAARYFVEGFGEDNLAVSEFLSPRDGTGHGSHVAAVAAGNGGVRVRVEGQDRGRASGVAPAARIASYKVCWAAPDPADDGCTTADAVAAVDQAVADGVDVISYAVSGPSGARSDSVELAFLNATEAGVFVATSAGNRGPSAGSVAHTSPWVATVGANTDSLSQGAVVLGDGEEHVGAMAAEQPIGRTGLVLAEDAAAPGSTDDEARLCRPGALAPAKVQDRIVVCDRGTVPRVEKSAAVAQAGGAGMVLANATPDTVDADFHAVPTVHVDVAAAEAIKRYVQDTAGAEASLDPTASDDTPVPQIAEFSSRGPAPVQDRSLVKPDFTAPGVGVLSATAPPSNDGHLWGLRSGSSVGAAHVAGLAALVRAAEPSWSPAAVKSAMSTTADGLEGVSNPLAEGAGQVDAADVLDPGLVFDESARSFRAWLADRTPTRDLNLPSIAVGDLTGSALVVRRVTNVSGSVETYTAGFQGLEALQAAVRPRTITLAPGESARFRVRFYRGSAPLEQASTGSLVWTGSRHSVRMPVVVTPRTLSAPEEATGSGVSGSLTFQGTSGTDGRIGLEARGLVGATPTGLTLEPGSFDPLEPDTDADTARFPVRVAPDAGALRVHLEGRDSDDVDVFLYRDGRLVASAAGSGADEVLTVVDPEPGEYDVFVASAVAGNGSTTTTQLYTWVLGDDDAGNVAVPDAVAVDGGASFDVDLSWEDLDPTLRWFGAVGYRGSDELTFVTIN